MKNNHATYDINLYNIWKKYTIYNKLLNNIWHILYNIWLHARRHIIKN